MWKTPRAGSACEMNFDPLARHDIFRVILSSRVQNKVWSTSIMFEKWTLLHFRIWIAPKINLARKCSKVHFSSTLTVDQTSFWTRDKRITRKMARLEIGSKFISHSYPAHEKVSFTYFTGSKFIHVCPCFYFGNEKIVLIWMKSNHSLFINCLKSSSFSKIGFEMILSNSTATAGVHLQSGDSANHVTFVVFL